LSGTGRGGENAGLMRSRQPLTSFASVHKFNKEFLWTQINADYQE
jgi:hypothetical protein